MITRKRYSTDMSGFYCCCYYCFYYCYWYSTNSKHIHACMLTHMSNLSTGHLCWVSRRYLKFKSKTESCTSCEPYIISVLIHSVAVTDMAIHLVVAHRKNLGVILNSSPSFILNSWSSRKPWGPTLRTHPESFPVSPSPVLLPTSKPLVLPALTTDMPSALSMLPFLHLFYNNVFRTQ